MKILHTSDWHLGAKIPYLGVDRTEEQEEILNRIKEKIEKDNIDVVMISGDIFDTPLPSVKAEKIFLKFIMDVAGDMGKKVLIINGNHDSIDKVDTFNILAKVLEKRVKCFVCPDKISEVELFTEVNGVIFIGIPFIPKYRFSGEYRNIFESILGFYLEKSRGDTVLFSHDIVTGAEYSGTEVKYDDKCLNLESIMRIGGSKRIVYWGLGHIHKHQKIVENRVYYSGSIIQLDFSEGGQDKGLITVSLADGQAKVNFHSLPQKYRLMQRVVKDDRDIETFLESTNEDDGSFVKLIVKNQVSFSLLEKLKIRRNVVIHLSFMPSSVDDVKISEIKEILNDPIETFIKYCKTENKEITEEEIRELKEIVEDIRFAQTHTT